MKPLALLLCLLFTGCEKRIADPELVEVREWLRSEVGKEAVVGALASRSDLSINELSPRETWVVRRYFIPSFEGMNKHLVFAPTDRETGLLILVDSSPEMSVMVNPRPMKRTAFDAFLAAQSQRGPGQ